MSNVTTTSPAMSAPKPMTPFQEFWHYFKRNKGAVVGLVYIIIVLVLAIGANVLAHISPQSSFVMRCLNLPFGKTAVVGNLFSVPMMSAVTCYRG